MAAKSRDAGQYTLKSLLLSWRLPVSLLLLVGAYFAGHNATYVAPFGATIAEDTLFLGKSYYPYVDNYNTAERLPVLQGWYWSSDDEASEQRWRLTTSGTAALFLNGEEVFRDDSNPHRIRHFEVEVTLHPGANFYRYEVRHEYQPEFNRLLTAIEEPRPLIGGWRLLPHSRLYPNEPGTDAGIETIPEQDQSIMKRYQLMVALFVVGSLWLGWLSVLRIHWCGEFLYIGAAFLLALIPRLLLVFGRAAHDPEFYSLGPGADNYTRFARDALAGGYTLAGSLWGPGNILWLTQLQRWLGPDPLMLHLVNAILGAASCALIADAARRIYGRRASKGTALLVALFPPLMLYQTSLYVEGMGTTLAAVLIWLMVVYIQVTPQDASKNSLWARYHAALVISCGIVTGALVLFRTNNVAFVIPLAIGLWWRNRSLTLTLLRLLPVLAVAVLTILPQTYANYASGYDALVSNNGPQNFHIGNNETSAGDSSFSVTFRAFQRRTTFESRSDAIWAGIQDDPARAMELILRKISLTWAAREDGNLISIHRSGVDASPFFAALYAGEWFNFSVLAWLGLVGLLLSPYRRRPEALFVAIVVVIFTASTAAVMAISRLRIPLALPLAISAGYGVAVISVRRIPWSKLLAAGGAAAGILLVLFAMESELPRPRYFSANSLPEGTIPLDVTFDDVIRLVGYQPLEHGFYTNGILTGRLYFERVGPVTEDYRVSAVVILPDDTTVQADQGDWVLGSSGYPDIPAQDWPDGRGLRDEFYIPLPAFSFETPAVARLGVLLYSPDGERASAVGSGTILGGDTLIVKSFGLVGQEDGELEDATPQDVVVNDQLRLMGSLVPEQGAAGETLTISTQWSALVESYEDFQGSVFLLNAAGEVVAQNDGGLLGENFPSSALLPGFPLRVDYLLVLPPDLAPGNYSVNLAAYRLTPTGSERLMAVGASGEVLADSVIELGEIEVTDSP
jgi:hypothetical protein